MKQLLSARQRQILPQIHEETFQGQLGFPYHWLKKWRLYWLEGGFFYPGFPWTEAYPGVENFSAKTGEVLGKQGGVDHFKASSVLMVNCY